MIDENFARLRTHRGNIQRYRHLLETSLTDFEREFVSKREGFYVGMPISLIARVEMSRGNA
jgi:hypothetical protein